MVSTTTAELVERILACPRCHGQFTVRGDAVRCQQDTCGFETTITDDVLAAIPLEASFFDERFENMRHEFQGDCVCQMCYGNQAPHIRPRLASGQVVLDIGCGSEFPYERDPGCLLIGLDASFATVRANQTLDLRIYGTAASIPLPDASIDTIICSYSVHHMTGTTVADNVRNLRSALAEFGRVLKPGGVLFILEVSPWLPVWIAERQFWTLARRILGKKLDMFFWSASALKQLSARTLPGGALEDVRIPTRWLSVFAPVFNLPWLKIPRFLYPFDIRLYRWQK